MQALCPWCGAELRVLGVYPRDGSIEWDLCRTPRCRGTRTVVVSDSQGFIIHPYHLAGKYVFARPKNGDVHEQEKDTQSV